MAAALVASDSAPASWPPTANMRVEDGRSIRVDAGNNRRYFGVNIHGVKKRACWGGQKSNRLEDAWVEICAWVGEDPHGTELKDRFEAAILGRLEKVRTAAQAIKVLKKRHAEEAIIDQHESAAGPVHDDDCIAETLEEVNLDSTLVFSSFFVKLTCTKPQGLQTRH